MLVTTKEILQKASMENYGVAATNVGSSVEVNAAIEAAQELKAPLILDILEDNLTLCPNEFVQWVLARCRIASVPIALNLDDGKTFEGALRKIQYGATSIMVDRSKLSFDENSREVKKIVEYAHAVGISCEAELGNNGKDKTDGDVLTKPEDALQFIKETKADCLAVAIRIEVEGQVPYLDLERLKAIKKAVGNYPLVLHGSLGITNEQIKKACTLGLNKVNISKDLKAASTQAILNSGGNGNALVLAAEGFKNKLKEMILVYGSSGKAQVL